MTNFLFFSISIFLFRGYVVFFYWNYILGNVYSFPELTYGLTLLLLFFLSGTKISYSTISDVIDQKEEESSYKTYIHNLTSLIYQALALGIGYLYYIFFI